MLLNTFSLTLVLMTVLTGLFYFYDYTRLRPTRMKNLQEAVERCPDLSKKERRRIKEGNSLITSVASLFPIVLIIFVFRAFIYEPFRIPSGSMEPTLVAGDFIAVSKWSYGIRNPLTNGVLIPTSEPKRGDVAVFKYPEDPSVDFIKRIVGLPGDEVIFDNKRVYIRKACNVGKVTPEAVEPLGADDEKTACESPRTVEQTAVGTVTYEGKNYQETYTVYEEQLGERKHKIQVNERVPDLSQYFYRQRGSMRGKWVVPEGYYFVLGDNRDNSKDSRFWGFVPNEYLVGRAVGIWLSIDYGEPDPESILPFTLPDGIRFERIGAIK